MIGVGGEGKDGFPENVKKTTSEKIAVVFFHT
jgi:hypothetical protein